MKIITLKSYTMLLGMRRNHIQSSTCLPGLHVQLKVEVDWAAQGRRRLDTSSSSPSSLGIGGCTAVKAVKFDIERVHWRAYAQGTLFLTTLLVCRHSRGLGLHETHTR